MLKFIIRLDDACPTMNEKKWIEIEKILDKYNIKPIVGIIPENKDKEFSNPKINNYWEKYPLRWQKKGWIIAQHGLNHDLSEKVRTEFKGKEYKEQEKIIKKGYDILKEKNIIPECFFAPAHTFDKNTIKVCNKLKYFKFISDGYAFYPYKYKGMMFIPSVFDTPHKITNNGVYTFIYHPNNISDKDLEYLEQFIIKYKDFFDVNIDYLLSNFKDRRKNIKDYILQIFIFLYRGGRNILGRKKRL